MRIKNIDVKFDSLLAQYLYEYRKLQLQGIGTFELDKAVTVNHEHDKETYYPIEGLTFSYNTKDVTNEDLITFLVKKLGKIEPLVRSDLESYLSNIKQFLNIGKPYTIEGVGTLNKNNQGTYEFTPGNFLPVKEELSPKKEKSEPSLKPPKAKSGGKAFAMFLIVIASLAVLGGIGWGVYTFVLKNDQTQELSSVDGSEENTDSTTTAAAKTDTTAISTAATSPSALSPDSAATYKMIFEFTPRRQRAITRTAQLNTLKINATYDTLGPAGGKYRIYVAKQLKATDTLRVRDSIAKFFLKKVTIARQ